MLHPVEMCAAHVQPRQWPIPRCFVLLVNLLHWTHLLRAWRQSGQAPAAPEIVLQGTAHCSLRPMLVNSCPDTGLGMAKTMYDACLRMLVQS